MEFSNIEEDSFEAKRRERRERMKEEKRRQAAKRAMLKKMIPLIITTKSRKRLFVKAKKDVRFGAAESLSLT